MRTATNSDYPLSQACVVCAFFKRDRLQIPKAPDQNVPRGPRWGDCRYDKRKLKSNVKFWCEAFVKRGGP